jgi:hypothetical protein
MLSTAALTWHPLESLDARFRTNLAALETRDAQLAGRLRALAVSRPFFIAAVGDNVFLGRAGATGIEVIADPVPPPAARALGSVSGPLAVAGLGYGWLWDVLAKIPCRVDVLPMHRPPIYFLVGDVEQLWAVLHVLDWRAMLAERRHPIFAGPDAIDQFRQSLIADPTLPEPRGLIRIDSTLPAQDLNPFMEFVRGARDERLADLYQRLHAVYAPPAGSDWPQRFRSGRLRVLGITSRYTTFLQHSMRDWLDAFGRMGHDVRLLIEGHDHQMLGAFGYAAGVLDFKPDLILVIDHYRSALGKLPESVPCVMWVQDRLPNIYCPAAGAAQGPRDYCIGFSRHHLSSRYGYPAERFLSCTVGVNEHRFEQTPLSPSDQARFGCDVSYVSHASTPADQVLRDHLAKFNSPELSRLFDHMYQRLEAWYAAGGIALSDVALREMLGESMASTGIMLTEEKLAESVIFFNHSVQNAIFRHQTLLWLADMGLNLHLWGKGWEKHPKLRRFARGVADNTTDLSKIYCASRINIQVTPHGSVHQRLLDGLAAGGFFLLRWHPGDAVGLIYRELLDWCTVRNVRSDAELHARADDSVRQIIARINECETSTPQNRQMSVFDVMNGHADMNFLGTADSVWPEYDRVAFNTRDELEAKVRHFLSAEQERRELSDSMRQGMLEKFSYASISMRLLNMIADDLGARSQKCAA